MDNPYQPSAHTDYPAATGQVSQGTMQALAATRPWVRLCSVLGFIGAGLMIFSACGMMIAGAMGTLGGPELMMGITYFVLAVIYLIPAIKLWKYGSAIVRLMYSSTVQDLEEALQQQRGFWKFTGIMIVIMAVLMVLAMVAAVFFTMTAARRMSS